MFVVCGVLVWFFFFREKYNISDQHLSYMCLSGLCHALVLIKLFERQAERWRIWFLHRSEVRCSAFGLPDWSGDSHSIEGRAPQNARTRCYSACTPCTVSNHPKVSHYNRISSQNEDKDGDSDNAISELPPTLQDVSPDRRRSSSDTSRSTYSLARRISSKAGLPTLMSFLWGRKSNSSACSFILWTGNQVQLKAHWLKSRPGLQERSGRGQPCSSCWRTSMVHNCMCRWTGREKCRPACASAWLRVLLIVGRARGKSLTVEPGTAQTQNSCTCNCFSVSNNHVCVFLSFRSGVEEAKFSTNWHQTHRVWNNRS